MSGGVVYGAGVEGQKVEEWGGEVEGQRGGGMEGWRGGGVGWRGGGTEGWRGGVGYSGGVEGRKEVW